MKRLLLAVSAALVLAAPAVAAQNATTTTTKTSATGTAAAANAPGTVACRNKIINEWEGTGKILTTYPIACYHLALTYVNSQADLSEYSSLGDDIKLALRAAMQRSHGQKVPPKVGKHYGAGPSGSGSAGSSGSGSTVGFTTTVTKPPADGDITPGSTTNATGAVGDSSSGAPLPILILGGVALALIAAGAVGTGVRYSRRRRDS